MALSSATGTSFSQTSAPSHDLYGLPDPAFVGAAYLRVLGRPADPSGFRHQLQHLRGALATRAAIVARLQNSEEAAGATPWPLAQATAHARLWPDQKRPKIRWRKRDVLSLRGDALIEAAFAWAAGRAPSADETRRHAALADQPGAQAQLIDAVRQAHGQRWWRPGTRAVPAESEQGGSAPSTLDAFNSARPSAAASAASRSDARLVLFTIGSARYLPFVRTLMASVREHHPGARRVMLLVDEPTAEAADAALFESIAACDIGVPCFDDMTLRYDITELSTALKPWCFLWLLANSNCDSVIFLDPDIRLYGPLDPVNERLEAGAAMVLTPHITAPLLGEGQPDDHTILKSGVFNLGFMALRRSGSALAFLQWWADKLRTEALVDFAANLFTDQRWCDFAPAFVPDLAVLHHPGCNVAYWNLSQRNVHRAADGQWKVGDQPLVFFHFSGLDPAQPKTLSRYQNRLGAGELQAVHELLYSYATEVMTNGWLQCKELVGAYDKALDTRITSVVRGLYRELHPRPAMLSREQGLSELLQQSASSTTHAPSGDVPLSPLMKLIHHQRPDLERCFDLENPLDRADYCDWFHASAVPQYQLLNFLLLANGHAGVRTEPLASS